MRGAGRDRSAFKLNCWDAPAKIRRPLTIRGSSQHLVTLPENNRGGGQGPSNGVEPRNTFEGELTTIAPSICCRLRLTAGPHSGRQAADGESRQVLQGLILTTIVCGLLERTTQEFDLNEVQGIDIAVAKLNRFL